MSPLIFDTRVLHSRSRHWGMGGKEGGKRRRRRGGLPRITRGRNWRKGEWEGRRSLGLNAGNLHSGARLTCWIITVGNGGEGGWEGGSDCGGSTISNIGLARLLEDGDGHCTPAEEEGNEENGGGGVALFSCQLSL